MFDKQVRSDFTIDELKDAAVSGQTLNVSYVRNTNYEKQYAAWREEVNNTSRNSPEWSELYSRQPKYYETDADGNRVVESEELIDVEDTDAFWSEGGYLHGIGTFEEVKGTYFNNGDGHDNGVVWEHLESGRLFRVVGTYSSWTDADYDDVEVDEVKPIQVLVTRYTSLTSDETKIYTDPTVDIV